MTTAAELGFTERVRFATGSQVPARLLIQTGRRAGPAHHRRPGRVHRGLPRPARAHRQGPPATTWRRSATPSGCCSTSGSSISCPARAGRSRSPSGWPRCRPPIRATMIAYLDRKRATCQPKTVSGIATRLKHFGVFLAHVDPGLDSIAAPRPAPTHRALPDLAGRRGELQERRADHRRRPVPAGARAGRVPRPTSPSGAGRTRRRASWCSATTSPSSRRCCPVTCPSTSTAGSPKRWSTIPATELAAAALRLQRCLRAAHRGTARPRAGLRARATRPRQLAEGPARQARHRADGPARRRDPRR